MNALERALLESSIRLLDADNDEQRYRAVAISLAVKLLALCALTQDSKVTRDCMEEAILALEFLEK
jgi:hypothetical protein